MDINDLTVVFARYGQTGMGWAQGEFTGSGTVDINNLTIVLANYGRSENYGSSAAGLAAVPAGQPGFADSRDGWCGFCCAARSSLRVAQVGQKAMCP